ncbi:hypothetical protein ACFWPH_23095 [Nocardia sp. NPDC058499]|uniref:hypothetical protein n=1 Tax=Nocardia sp. NPDC058499 TaxID=3346530 RepID=UPI003659FA35
MGGAVGSAGEPDRRRTRAERIAGDDSVPNHSGASGEVGTGPAPTGIISGDRTLSEAVAVHRPAVRLYADNYAQVVVQPLAADPGSRQARGLGVGLGVAAGLVVDIEPGVESVVRRFASFAATCAGFGRAVLSGRRAIGAGRLCGVPAASGMRTARSALAADFTGARALDDARAGKWSWWLVRTVVRLRR